MFCIGPVVRKTISTTGNPGLKFNQLFISDVLMDILKGPWNELYTIWKNS